MPQLPWSPARRSHALDQVCVQLHARWRQLLVFMAFRWCSRIPIYPRRSSLSLLSPASHPTLLPICWSCISAVTSGPPPKAGHSLLGTSSPAPFNKSLIPLNSYSLFKHYNYIQYFYFTSRFATQIQDYTYYKIIFDFPKRICA